MGAKLCKGAEKEPKTDGGVKPQKQKPVKASRLMKVCMAGTSSCGKTTIAKQMRMLHCNGFTDEEKDNYKKILISNVFVAFKEMVNQSKKMGIAIEHEEAAKTLASTDPYSAAITPELVNHVKALWGDSGIKEVYGRRNEFDIPPNTEHCMNMIDKLADPDFLISTDDILRARQRTTGITDNTFTIGKYTWNLVDLGGQRAERRKWALSFQGVVGMIYIAALDDWDVVLPEDNKKTRLQESLEVFESMVTDPTFDGKPWILFMNKKDLFENKIKSVELSKTFPQYKGGADYEKGVKFITDMFLAKNTTRNEDDVFVHVTCALDTEQVKVVFNSVTEFVFNKSIELAGVM